MKNALRHTEHIEAIQSLPVADKKKSHIQELAQNAYVHVLLMLSAASQAGCEPSTLQKNDPNLDANIMLNTTAEEVQTPKVFADDHKKDAHAEHGHVDMDKLRDAAWQKEQPAYDKLMRLDKGESLENVYGKEAILEAFKDRDLEIICIDERARASGGRMKFAIAGSGVLLSAKQMQDVMALAKAKKLRVVEVSFHEYCGACAICLKNEGDLKPTEEKKEDRGEKVATAVKKTLGLQGAPVRVGYSKKAHPNYKMDGVPELHHARAILIDGTGRLKPEALGLPSVFEIDDFLESQVGIDPQYSATEESVATDIAMGDHGFGAKRFDAAKGGQELAIIIAEDPRNPQFSFDAILARYRDKIEAAKAKYGAKTIKIVRLTPPVEALK